MIGTLINVGAVLLGTLAGTVVGARLPKGVQQRVLAGLGLATLVLGMDYALAWRDTNPLIVIGAVLLGGLAGEAMGIERGLERLGDAAQRRFSGTGPSTVSQGFFTASVLFCVGPLAVLGPIQDGLTGDYRTLATKALLDGFAAVALASTLGWGVALSAISVLLVQGAIALGAGLFDDLLRGEALAALTSAGGVLILGIALRLLEVRDVKVGNFLPALLLAPALVGVVRLF